MDNRLIELEDIGCDIEGALDRILNDEDLLIECIAQVISDSGFDSLKQAIEGNNADEGFMAAHSLKGVAGNVGLTPLYDEICVIVEKLRDRKMTDLSSLLPILSNIEEIKAQIEDIISD